jgi:hypothetical protein
MNAEDEQSVRESLLTAPLPPQMLDALEHLMRKNPIVSVLQGCSLYDHDDGRLEADLTYTVFVPILAENMCILQEFHNSLVFIEEATMGVEERASVENPFKLSLPSARREWDARIRNGWLVYLRNAVVS